MKIKKELTIAWVLCLALIIATVPIMSCAQPAPSPAPAPKPAPSPAPSPAPAPKAEPITLKGLTFVSVRSGTNTMYIEWIKRVNEAAKGELTIELAGGPELIQSFDQYEAVRTGVIDMSLMPASYYKTVLPAANSGDFSEFNIAEQRERGYMDLMVELHKPVNLYYMGKPRHGPGFYLWTNIPANTPYDMAGQKMRTGSLYDDFMRELGILPITMPQSDVYTAIERGLISGFGDTPATVIRLRFFEVTKYRVNHAFYTPNVPVVVNLDTWNSIPKHLQDLMQKLMIEIEVEAVAHYDGITESNDKQILDGGMEFIEFSPTDAKWYVDTAYRAAWKALEEKVGPEMTARLKDILTK
ncbi:TRAP transporter substrate-binding protein DctP [Chloroflexota bacterium]